MNSIAEIINSVTENLNSELRGYILTGEIPLCETPKDENYCITIFVTRANVKVSKKSKVTPIDVSYSEELDFDLQNLSRWPTPVTHIWTIFEPDLYPMVLGKIKNWSRLFFKKAWELCHNEYNLDLMVLPFQVYCNEDNKLFVSKLPKFTDLRFRNKNPDEPVVDATDFINSQANAIFEVSQSITEYQNSVKNSQNNLTSNSDGNSV